MKKLLFLASALALIGAGCATNQTSVARPVTTPVPPQVAPPTTPLPTPPPTPPPAPPQRGGGTEPAAQVQTVNVTIKNFAFAPATITVKKGDKIVFTNQDGANHTATADDGSFESGTLNQGQSYTLDTSSLAARSFPYHCAVHPNMKATIVVQ